MRTKLAAIAIAVLASSTALAVNSVGARPPERQSLPDAAQAAERIADAVNAFWIRSGGQ